MVIWGTFKDLNPVDFFRVAGEFKISSGNRMQVFPVSKDTLTSLSNKEINITTRLDSKTLFMILCPAFQIFFLLPFPYLLVAARTGFFLLQQCLTNIFPSETITSLIRAEGLILFASRHKHSLSNACFSAVFFTLSTLFIFTLFPT